MFLSCTITVLGALSAPPLALSRRAALLLAPVVLPHRPSPAAAAAPPPALDFKTAGSGLQYADAKVGSGQPFQSGQRVAIDYVMSTSGARAR